MELAELGKGVVALAGDALAVEADVGEHVGLFAQSLRFGECGVYLLVSGVNLAYALVNGEREEIGFTGGGVQTPTAIGDDDLATFASVAVVLAGVAPTACYISVRRAMRVDPVVALRHD